MIEKNPTSLSSIVAQMYAPVLWNTALGYLLITFFFQLSRLTRKTSVEFIYNSPLDDAGSGMIQSPDDV